MPYALTDFHVWTASTVDEGIELLTGLTAGTRDAEGRFPQGTLQRVSKSVWSDRRRWPKAEHNRPSDD